MYNVTMNKVYVSAEANELLKKYLRDAGYTVCEVGSMAVVDPAIACHPDIYMCSLRDSVYKGDPALLGADYPAHAIFNGCSTGKYFLHNLKITDPGLLEAVRIEGQTEIHVAQGYAKCSCVVVDENSIITADKGIEKVAAAAGLSVLLVKSGQVVLEGYDYGFLGGASGRVGRSIVFNGDITRHSDWPKIRKFIHDRGLETVYFSQYPLTDIGTITEEK